MITLITALYPEAKGFIEALGLKKNSSETHYQLFESEKLHLLITGSGMISAASCVARHFTLYPASPSDVVINFGVAGYVPAGASNASLGHTVSLGNLFLISKITEHMTGRTFYPDILYQNEFAQLPLVTVATPATDASLFPEQNLIDMEASALYQALLPFFSPERMFFFKVVSDVLADAKTLSSVEGKHLAPAAVSSDQTTQLIAPHIKDIFSFAAGLEAKLAAVSRDISFSAEEHLLIEELYKKLPLTETTKQEVSRLFRYTKLTGASLAPILTEFLSLFPTTPVRGKKQAAPYLDKLTELILQRAPLSCSSDVTTKNASYLPFFSTVYVEKELAATARSGALPDGSIEIEHYKDVFNRSRQNFAEQKKAPSLILAKKTGTLLYQGAPVCQSFGNNHFYYTSCMMNCVYHCDYCYLQGMYPSGHVVVFANLADYFGEVEALLKQHPVYLCISYDTDLLALEQRFGFVKQWLTFAATHEDLTLEIRTKSGNPSVFKGLETVYRQFGSLSDAEAAKRRIIFAWTVSPDTLIKSSEHGAASLSLRIKALCTAKEAGFSVRLCFDPMIYHAGWKENYSALVQTIFREIAPDDLYDVSIGVFRISTEYLKTMRKKRPDSAIVQFPYITENGVSHYGTLSEEMVHYLQELLLPYLPAEKIFLWNGGD